jgi:hypothetical protein
LWGEIAFAVILIGVQYLIGPTLIEVTRHQLG